MKKIAAILLLSSLYFSAHAHSIAPEYYKVTKNQVYYDNAPIANADSETFKITSRAKFAKDKNQAYFKGSIIEGADPETFTSKATYGKDKNKVYFIVNEKLEILPNADAESFQEITFGYYQDKHAIYHHGKALPELNGSEYSLNGNYIWNTKAAYFNGDAIKEVDARSFTVLEYIHPNGTLLRHMFDPHGKPDIIYAKDKNAVYYKGKIIPNAKSNTFEVISFYCAKDDNYVYCGGKKTQTQPDIATFVYLVSAKNYSITPYYKDKNQVYVDYPYNSLNVIEGADPDSFTFGEYASYATDKSFVYFGSEKIEGSHGPSFSTFKNAPGYAKDKNQVYFYKKILPQANPETFNPMSTGYSIVKAGKDHQHVYHDAEIVDGVDAQSFELIDGAYSKDKNQVYYHFKPVENADPDTFSKLEGTHYYQDKSRVFYQQTMLPDSDPQSLRALNRNNSFTGYARDDKQVYFYEKIVQDADLATFEVTGWFEAKDKNYKYYKDQRVSSDNP